MRRNRPLLGTSVEVSIEGLPPPQLERAIEEAFAVAPVGRLVSFHSPDSDLPTVSPGASPVPVKVHPRTARAIGATLALLGATDGLFGCAVASELMC